MAITQLEAYKNKETIEHLEDLLERTKNGEILGLVFCVKLGPKRHAMGVSGRYVDDPVLAVAVTARMHHRLNTAADSLEDEPAKFFSKR